MTDISLFAPEAYASGCPHDRIAQLHADGGVSWQDGVTDPSSIYPEISGGWWVHRYDDVKAILRDPRRFSSQRGSVGLMDIPADQLELASSMFINMDPPDHSRHRRLVSAMFSVSPNTPSNTSPSRTA